MQVVIFESADGIIQASFIADFEYMLGRGKGEILYWIGKLLLVRKLLALLYLT